MAHVSRKSLTYFEIDVPYCILRYGEITLDGVCPAVIGFIGDGNDSLTKALLHFDGTDQQTTITDSNEGGSAHTWTAAGNAQLDTADKKFGSASLLLDGTGDFESTPDSTDFDLGSNNFQIDFWFKCNTAGGTLRHLCGQNATPLANSTTSFRINRTTGNVIEAIAAVGAGGVQLTGTTQFTNAVNTGWHHCAFIRSGNTAYLFIDGVLEDSDTLSGTVNNVASVLAVGAAGAHTSDLWIGWIDEFSLRVGTAAPFWTIAFTPPRAAYGSLGGSPIKCFNTIATCPVQDSYIDDPVTLRFALPTNYLPPEIECLPDVISWQHDPAVMSPGVSLGLRSSITIMFQDKRHSDTGDGYDKYHTERTYNPFNQGTHWGKFRARQPFMRGLPLRWIQGELGQTIDEMDIRHFVIDSFDGPTMAGVYTIKAKDPLKFADYAQAPNVNTGFLDADIAIGATALVLAPVGIGNEEYPTTGYANIGGNEIVAFVRDDLAGNDANTKLLLTMNGSDTSITFTDTSSSAKGTASIAGAVQVDTAQSKFGEASCLFIPGGTDSFLFYVDHADWTPAGNFTFDCWIRVDSLADNRTICHHSNTVDANNRYTLSVLSTGAIQFLVISGGSTIITLSSAISVIAINTWYHIALVRSGNDFNIYVDGVSVASVTDSDAIPNFNQHFRIGIREDGTTSPMSGWIDEFRFSHVARWTANFTPPAQAYLTSSDVMLITREQFGSIASAHSEEDRVQVVLVYDEANVADIIYDLLVTYADIDPTFIDLPTWQAETDTHLGVLFGAAIAEPTQVSELIEELVKIACLSVWFDEENDLIELQVLRAISNNAGVLNSENIMQGSLNHTEQPNLRISQSWCYYGQIDATKGNDEDNFRSVAVQVDLQSEAPSFQGGYGSRAIKKEITRWVPQFANVTAERYNALQIARYVTPPRRFNLSVFKDGVTQVEMGGGYRLNSWPYQAATGAEVDVPIQIVSKRNFPERWELEAEESLFDSPELDISTHPIVIDVDTFNFDLREVFENIYGDPNVGDEINLFIDPGVVVGSNSISLPALTVGTWPSGVIINVFNNGRIQGRGGNGGPGGGGSGDIGGKALYTRQAINLTDTNGETWGGGGGGGGGGFQGGDYVGGGGGGGAGTAGGNGGAGAAGNFQSGNGSPGTATAGGVGGFSGDAGAAGSGGGPGAAGSGGVSGGSGGAAGSAIDGISFVTTVGAAGSRLGGQIN